MPFGLGHESPSRLMDGLANKTVLLPHSNPRLCPKKAAEHHHKAAEHHEHAARHHKEAAKHHEAGKHETAAHHAQLARGHHEHVMHHAAEAAKAHIEDHGKALAAQA